LSCWISAAKGQFVVNQQYLNAVNDPLRVSSGQTQLKGAQKK
jgi:hypothetical protein